MVRRLALVALLVLGACTGSNEPAAGPEATASSVPTIPTDAAAPSASPSASTFSAEDAVLDVAITEPSTLDPMRIQDPGAVLVARQLYESLTAWDQAEEQVVPAAAESWKVSKDGTRFTFTLRQGMTFHDGGPVTAGDFVYAFNRIAKKKNGSELAYTLDKVKGFDQVNQFGDSKKLSGLKAVDDDTLQITLSRPFVDFPAVLTHPGLVPLEASVVKDVDTFLERPVGNGPFQIAEDWTPGDPIVLTRFEGFLRTPALDGIRFLSYPDAAAAWLQFVGGELDVAEVPAGQVEAAAEVYGEAGYEPFLAGYYYGFDLRSKELSNKRLRTAINLGIDREAIAEQVYKGTMVAPRGIVPSGMPGFQENICLDLCSFDEAKAKRLVDRLPRKKRKVVVEYTAGDPHDDVARLVRKDLRAAGLEVKVKAYAFNKYLKRLSKGSRSMYRLGWIAEYPIPDVFLSSLFGSSSPDNHSGFSSGKVDKLLAKAHAQRSDNKRLQLYKEAEKKILAQAPIVPIGSFVTHWAAQEGVEGITFDVMGGFDAVGIKLGTDR